MESKDADDVESLRQLVHELRQREQELVNEKKEMENDFGQKRAQLKELFLQKEEELNREKSASEEARREKETLQTDLCKLQAELNESKSLVAIAECQKENEIEAEKQKCQEEIASLQHIMKEAMADASRNSSGRFEKELVKLKKTNDKLEAELSEIKNQQSKDRESVLAVVTKSLKQRVGGLGSPIPFSSSSDNAENLEESMKKAQEDAEMLRSLVIPLEEEIKALKDKLRTTDEHLRMYETAFSGLVKGLGSDSLAEMLKGKSPAEVVGHLDDKLTSLSQGLQAEKASRSDLEMYVAVLNTQKSVMQDDMDRIKKELQEVCELLEKEKREHVSLKRTWQMANDQFLEAQRLQFMDMRRMQTVLTAEQQRQIAEMQRKDAERMEQERRLTRLQIPNKLESQEKAGSPLSSKLTRRTMSPMMHRRFCSADNKSVDLIDSFIPNTNKCQSAPEGLSETGLEKLQRIPSKSEMLHLPTTVIYCKEQNLWRSVSLNGLTEKQLEQKSSQGSDITAETRSLPGLEDGSSSPWSPKKLPSLTQDQLKALVDITPELEARKSLLDNARAEMESISLVGKRLVSEKEWQLLEEEVRRAREKLGQPCQMCSNYELQLQQVQKAEQEQKRKMSALQQGQERYKEDLKKEQAHHQEIEQKFSEMATDSQNQISELKKALEESEKITSELRNCYNEVYNQQRQLIHQREEMRGELTKLQEENNGLLGKHIMQAQQMQSEIINFPDKPEEMQFLCLKLHEDLIAALISREKIESTLKSDILFLRDQLEAEQNAKDNLEDALTQEINNLQEQVGILESLKTELDKEQARRHDAEEKLKTTHGEMTQKKEDSQQQLVILQMKIEELSDLNKNLECEMHELKSKVQSLQNDLDISEAVQKDFVKLSQSLQVELEKIRQSDCEVRWQHDDDVTECNACKKIFHSRKEKQHCKHCGKVFCAECTSKVVHSGPQNRLFKVCNVCHTLLDRDTAPYFSSQPPQTPD